MLKKNNNLTESNELFKIDGKPSFLEALPLAFQHIVAMFVGNVAPILIVSRVAKLDQNIITILIQCSMLTAAIATFIQIYPISIFGLQTGSGLPIVMGVSFGFLPTTLAILAGGSENLPILFGSQIMGGIVSILIGGYLKKIRKFFPPLVAGTVVFSIGLSLFPIGINYMAGGVGSPTYGSYENWAISLIVLGIVLFFNHYTKGITKLSSILIGMSIGYIISLFLGIVDFTPVKEASWFALPKFFVFGAPKFEIGSIIAMSIMYLVTAIQAVGDLSAVTLGGMNREVTDKELSGGVIGNGFGALVASALNSFPTATYSQNVGLVVLTKVVSRYVIGIAASFLLIAGFVPKFGALINTIPSAVIGGGTITVFSMISMTGIQIISKNGITGRTMIIVGLSVALGSGIGQVPQAIAQFPQIIKLIFGSSVVMSTLLALLLNLLLPKEEEKK
ncbi:MAG: purine permease [Fusobacterium perfoetens]|uniref:uracil-xanthine permease family protein n=1 Tax=Fusobacterium perfoetens TaxID=852 RepID=UPI0023F15FB1|nr:nucleobase:cation symporter-2 family protein [Fusobacterium perfoetens]MCI6152027.1 purine permease [Fusobacterium perfoetens]MDY3238082.1 nucleobase:cation symporter-2 family protein [Fusobacterium perfoetens]